MLKRCLLIGFVLLALTSAAHAQEDSMSNELPPPAEEMQQLSWFIGKWDVTSRFLNEGEWIEEHLTTDHTLILGGHVIFEHFGGPVFQAPFEAWSLRKYNVNTGMWDQRWVDVSPGGFADWSGSWDEETQTYTGYANRYLNEDRSVQQTAIREVFSDITEDSFAWRYETTEDGGETWTVTWTLDYVRRTAE
jgi:hypothetical protein